MTVGMDMNLIAIFLEAGLLILSFALIAIYLWQIFSELHDVFIQTKKGDE